MTLNTTWSFIKIKFLINKKLENWLKRKNRRLNRNRKKQVKLN